MSKTERNEPIRLDQGSTSLLIGRDKARVVTRGATLDFNTVNDLETFAAEISILMVLLSSEREKNPPTTDEPIPPITEET